MSKKRIYAREYQIGTCFLCQKCFTCEEQLSFKHCKCDLSIKIKNTKKRKSYSRVYDSKTKNKIYNNLQLSELNKANKTYSYEVDFSQKFNYSLCFVYHNLMARLKKSQSPPIDQSKSSKPNCKSQTPRLTRLKLKISANNDDDKAKNQTTKSVKSKLQKSIVSDSDGVEEIDEVEFEKNLITNEENEVQTLKNFKTMEDIEQDIEIEYDDEVNEINNLESEESDDNDDTFMEISFKLVIKREGKNSPAKWETIYQTSFDNFMKDLYFLIQDQIDELVLHNDYIISYRHAKGSGIGTHLLDKKDWKMFLKKYQKLNSQEKEMMIIANQKFKT